MLSIGKLAAGPQAARYYTDQVAHGREDYYTGECEAPGTWVGSGAGSLNMRGEADAGRLTDLLAGAGLRRPPAEGAVAGFDLTFRAPKSVSVVWAVASPEVAHEVRAGHDAAVSEALDYLEREACRARRGAGGRDQVSGRGFVAAAFLHRASRAGDPLLHTHVVVGNLTQGPDGRWTALDARHLYRQAKTAGYLYQAVLRRELTERLGIEWQRVQQGIADVRGVPRSVIEHFSRRRAQIVEHMAAHRGRSAASAQVAALETRRAKQDVPIDRLRELWRSRAAEQGLDARAAAELFDPARAVGPQVHRIAPDELTEKASTFGRPEVLQALAQAQPTGARVADIERAADAMLAETVIVRLEERSAPAGLPERRFTTCAMLRVERDLIAGAAARKDAAVGIASPAAISETLSDRQLAEEQRDAVRRLCRSGHGVAVLRAPAGTGKTFTLDAAREAWEQYGIDVVGCALSARAALELQDQAGIASLTIAVLRRRLQQGHELPCRGVLVVDEAGMVGTRALADLAAAVERVDGKLVLVGDDRQLPEIDAGGAFRALARQPGAIELREVRRQRHAWDREALDALRSGEVERWARAYRDRGHITVARSAAAARAALVNDWFRTDGDRLMIAARRADVQDLNDRARELLRADGALGPDELEAAGRPFAVGDRVVGRRNDRERGILNGQRGTVREIDRERRTVAVELDGGHRAMLDTSYLDAGHLDHGYAITAHRAQGATVDSAFVLGSEELYREWGYTALSRHREEARFYVARGDLGLDRDDASPPEPLMAGLERLLGRSRAKQLALEGLQEVDDGALRREQDDLREGLQRDPPPRPEAGPRARELELAAEALSHARQREAALRERRAALRWFERRERSELDAFLDLNARQIAHLTERWGHAHAGHDRRNAIEQGWLLEHGAEAERYLAVKRELGLRAVEDRDAARRIEHFQRRPDPLERRPELRARHVEPGLGIDLD